MNATIPQPPTDGRWLSLPERARLACCGQCWAQQGAPCCLVLEVRSGQELPADHLARYQRAEQRGLITRQELTAVVAGLLACDGVVASHVTVLERAA